MGSVVRVGLQPVGRSPLEEVLLMKNEQWIAHAKRTDGVRIGFIATHCGDCACVGVIEETEYAMSQNIEPEGVEYRRRPPSLFVNVSKAGVATHYTCNVCMDRIAREAKTRMVWS